LVLDGPLQTRVRAHRSVKLSSREKYERLLLLNYELLSESIHIWLKPQLETQQRGCPFASSNTPNPARHGHAGRR